MYCINNNVFLPNFNYIFENIYFLFFSQENIVNLKITYWVRAPFYLQGEAASSGHCHILRCEYVHFWIVSYILVHCKFFHVRRKTVGYCEPVNPHQITAYSNAKGPPTKSLSSKHHANYSAREDHIQIPKRGWDAMYEFFSGTIKWGTDKIILN